LIAGYLFARARQNDKAREALQKVSADDLSPSELELFKQANAALEPPASTPTLSPLQQFLDALKQ
jgi:hypothetical protein